jgi:glycosyltransferase involved in cell wall biosynthesis
MMRVAYIYDLLADDVTIQSGRPWSILKQLERRAELETVFPLSHRMKYAFMPKRLAYRMIHRTYRPDREPAFLRSLARQARERLANRRIDRIFAPGSHVLSFLELDVPKVLCADATFAAMVDQYDGFCNCAPEYLRQGHEQEARALQNCAAAIFPSEWAARSAINDYSIDPRKVHVVPFGANLEVPPADLVGTAINRRTFDRFRILFVGREWKRKGGDVVLRAAELARRDGVPVEVDVVGPDRIPEALPDYVTWHGLILKRTDEGRARLERLFSDAHVMFVPSRAENFGMTFCEAAAYGLPSLTTNVGGIPTIVRNGVTGWSLAVESDARAYADVIGAAFADQAEYRRLAHSSRAFYDANLTWDAFGDRLMEILQ